MLEAALHCILLCCICRLYRNTLHWLQQKPQTNMVQVADARERHMREAEAAVHEQELERRQLAEEECQAAAAKASFPVCCSVLSSACAVVVAQAIKTSCLAETLYCASQCSRVGFGRGTLHINVMLPNQLDRSLAAQCE